MDYLMKLSAIRNYDRLATTSDRIRARRRAEIRAQASKPDGLAQTERLRAELDQTVGRHTGRPEQWLLPREHFSESPAHSSGVVVDACFGNPKLAGIYDELDGDRADLAAYLAIVDEFAAERVLDVGCGTGTFALMLAGSGCDVTGIDPALASLEVARRKPGADRVSWLHGDAGDLPPMQVDLVTMTANVACAIADPVAWATTLRGIHAALRPGGRCVFEMYDPAARAWDRWNRAASHTVTGIPGSGTVESWVELTGLALPLVSFRWTYVFASDGATLTSDSTLRFRERPEVERELAEAGFTVDEIRDAPDRPGRELVFIASKRAG